MNDEEYNEMDSPTDFDEYEMNPEDCYEIDEYDEYDGQPTEFDEWQSFDPDC